MSDAADTSTVREIVRFQLALLDLYESALDSAHWDEARVTSELARIMKQAYEDIREVAQKERCSLREAAFVLGVGRVAQATNLRGV